MITIARKSSPQVAQPNVRLEDLDINQIINRRILDLQNEGKTAMRSLDPPGGRQRVPGVWRPNMIRGCLRRQVYHALKCPRTDPPPNVRLQKIFDRGHVYEAWFNAYMLELDGHYGVSNVTTDIVVHDDVAQIGGKYDLAFDWYGLKVIIEVKSKGNYRAFEQQSEPDPAHAAQNNDYVFMSGADAGMVVYAAQRAEIKGGGKPYVTTGEPEFKPFLVKPSRLLWQQTKDRIAILDHFREDPSKLAPATGKKFECEKCRFRPLCENNIRPKDARR